MMFHIYHADCIGDPSNCSYPHADEITDAASLGAAIQRDYVCAEYQNHYRSNENFIGSDCLPVDCDNDHTENPEDWIYPSDVAQAFPNVSKGQKRFITEMYETFGDDVFSTEMVIATLDYSGAHVSAYLHQFTLLKILDCRKEDVYRYQFLINPEEHPEYFEPAA